MYTSPKRPRPVHPINACWPAFSLCGVIFYVGMFVCFNQGTEVSNVIAFGLMLLGFCSVLVAGIMFYNRHIKQHPISGRVTYRYVEGGGYATNVYDGHTTMNGLTRNPAGFNLPEVRYWLYVTSANRWFTVPKDVFDAHKIGTDYDARKPKPVMTTAHPDV